MGIQNHLFAPEVDAIVSSLGSDLTTLNLSASRREDMHRGVGEMSQQKSSRIMWNTLIYPAWMGIEIQTCHKYWVYIYTIHTG